jgi:hypothetical protein
MRAASFLLAAGSLVFFLIVLARGTTFEIVPVEGLLNPALQIGLKPGKETRLLESMLVWFFCTYLWLVVAWVDRSLTYIATKLACRPEPEAADHQPAEIRQLKKAIREADTERVRALLKKGIRLPVEDGSRLTLLELAELYDQSAIIELIRTAQTAAAQANRRSAHAD